MTAVRPTSARLEGSHQALAVRVKAELCSAALGRRCCHFWEVRGFADAWGAALEPRLSLRTDLAGVARRFYGLARALEASPVEIVRRPGGGYVVTVALPSTAVGDREGAPGSLPHGRCCVRSYIRGCFLARGFLDATRHGYHWEIKTRSEGQAIRLSQALAVLGLRGARVGRWQRGWVVYVKDAEEIARWLGLVKAHESLLEFENTRVARQMRGAVNRRVNYETANLGRTVSAAVRQTRDIRFIASTVGLGSLPPALRTVAEARLAQPDASLAELAALLDPPLSKSGASHRMRRVLAWAERVHRDLARRQADVPE